MYFSFDLKKQTFNFEHEWETAGNWLPDSSRWDRKWVASIRLLACSLPHQIFSLNFPNLNMCSRASMCVYNIPCFIVFCSVVLCGYCGEILFVFLCVFAFLKKKLNIYINWRFVATPGRASLLVSFFQQHFFTPCLSYILAILKVFQTFIFIIFVMMIWNQWSFLLLLICNCFGVPRTTPI